MSTIKVDNIDSKDSTGNITISRPIVATLTAGSINNLNNLLTPANASVTAAKMATTDTLPAWNGSALTNLPVQTPPDNSVTGAKLNISLLAGDTMYASGTDTLAKLPKGTAAQVLAMNSGATAPEWADAAGGAWNLKDSGTLTTATELLITSITNTIQIRMTDMDFSAATVIKWYTSTDNGSSWLQNSGASGYHMSIYRQLYGSAPTENSDVGGPGGMQMKWNPCTADILIDISMPQKNGHTMMHWQLGHFTKSNGWNASEYGRSTGTMINHADRIINAVKFVPYSGTMTGHYQILEMSS